MTPEEVLSHLPRALTQAQRESYFENGYLSVERFVDGEWLEAAAPDRRRVRRAESRRDPLGERVRHRPRPLRRCAPPSPAQAPGRVVRDLLGVRDRAHRDVAADLVGPDVVFHHSKLNYKWNDGADQVDWHQDIQFYPHTNYSPLTIAVYLQNTGFEDGALGFIPGSHRGALFDQYNDKGQWVRSLAPTDVATLPASRVVYVEAPAGSITVHNCRTVHGSPASRRDDGRPLLLNAYASADEFPYTPHPDPSRHSGTIVRGRPARWAHHDPRPCLIPPDWSGGYTSIFAAQTGEDMPA